MNLQSLVISEPIKTTQVPCESLSILLQGYTLFQLLRDGTRIEVEGFDVVSNNLLYSLNRYTSCRNAPHLPLSLFLLRSG
jgi:hypothetical protein